jgi:hypothetical protein
MVTDTRLTELVKRFGRDHAQAVWDAGLAATQRSTRSFASAIDARFQGVDGYLHARLTDDVGGESKRLQEDATSPRDGDLTAR